MARWDRLSKTTVAARFGDVDLSAIPPAAPIGAVAALLQLWAILPFSERPPVHPDAAIFMYGGGLLARGYAPYVYVFDVKPPLIYETLALLNVLLPAEPLVQFWAAVLLTGLAFVGFVVVTVELVGELTGSRLGAAAAGVTLLTYPAFYLFVAMGPWVKHFALLAGVAGLYALQRDRPFIAGGLGAAAAGFWPMAVAFPAIVLVEVLRRDGADGRRAVGGAAVTTAIAVVPIVVVGGGTNMFFEVVVLNLARTEPFEPIARASRMVYMLGGSSFLLGVGAFGILREVAVDRSRWWLLAGAAFAGVQVLFLDFDFFPDLFMLVFWGALGVGFAVANVDDGTAQWLLTAAVLGTLAFVLVATRGALFGEGAPFLGNHWDQWAVYRAVWEQTFPAETCMQWIPNRVEWARGHGLRLPEGCRFPDSLRG